MTRKERTTFNRLLALCAYMEALPDTANDHFKMKTVVSISDMDGIVNRFNPDDISGQALLQTCGTTACALGWAATMPAFRRLGARLTTQGVKIQGHTPVRVFYFMDVVYHLFPALSTFDAVRLFGGDVKTGTPKKWASRTRAYLKNRGWTT